MTDLPKAERREPADVGLVLAYTIFSLFGIVAGAAGMYLYLSL